MPDQITRNAVDERIWAEELDEFVPQKVYDAHTHIYRLAFNTIPDPLNGPYGKLLGPALAEATWSLANKIDQLLFPGRDVQRLAFPFPFDQCDFEASNSFLAGELKGSPKSAGLMLVHPSMTAQQAEALIDRYGFVGFKPYRFYSVTGDAADCRITDFLPEHLIEVAGRRGLIIMMHISKRDAIADPDNIADVVRLTQKYPKSKWILAHCARSYSTWAIEKAAKHLRGLPNVWYDTSSVCESDAIEALYNSVGIEPVMYGSDDIPVGVLRGKYIAFGYAWAYLSETNHSLGLSHCNSQMTYTRYEQLRAMKRAGKRFGMNDAQRQALFHDTAEKLVAAARRDAFGK